MGYVQSPDDYFSYESRLASFLKAHPVSKRRASNTSLKGPKSLKWPHKFLSASDLAKSGFYYLPSLTSPDNVVCFLCHKLLDGWEETDNPFVEHLRHSPNCGWAITTSVERSIGEWNEEQPNSTKLLEARKATFADRWPHEDKKGWKCHVKQMIEAGWSYTPTLQSDDMVTCNYCALTFDNWGKNDKPSDKHYESSPDCPFFALTNNYIKSPETKKISPKRTRASWTNRFSAQSNLSTCSNGSRETSFSAEEKDSILTMVSTSSQKMAPEKKKAQIKIRKHRLRRNEAAEVTKPEGIVGKVQDLNRGRKRISEESQISGDKKIGLPPKRRTARNRDGTAADFTKSQTTMSSQQITNSQQRIAKSTMNRSLVKATTSITDSDIEKVLEADLDRPISEDETLQNEVPRVILKSNYTVFNNEHKDIDDDALEVDTNIVEKNVKPSSRLRVTRSTSSSEQRFTHREVDEFKSQGAQNESLDFKISAELGYNLSAGYSSPLAAPATKGRASSRKATRKLAARNTRSSAMSPSSHNSSMAVNSSALEMMVEPRSSSKGKHINYQNPIKSISSSNQVENEDNDKRCDKKPSSRTLKENNPATEILKSHTFSQKLVSSSKKNEGQNSELESTENKCSLPNSTNSENRPSLDPPVGTIEIKDNKSTKHSDEKKLPNSSFLRQNVLEIPKLNSSEVERSVSQTSKSPMASTKTSISRRREATPQSSPACSDAENKPPSLKLSLSNRNITTPPKTRRVVTIDETPIRSLPSKHSTFVGLQSDQPWSAVDPEKIFLKSPTNCSTTSDVAMNQFEIVINAENNLLLTENPLEKAIQQGGLTNMEEKMTVEEWIHHNAHVAEEMLKRECERMVNKFELEGTRAIRALEGVRCVE